MEERIQFQTKLVLTMEPKETSSSMSVCLPLPNNCYSPQPVDKELLRDVVFAVGVLEGEVELVVLVEHGEAVLCVGARTTLRPARPVDVDLDVLLELFGVLEAAVAGAAIGHKPSDS